MRRAWKGWQVRSGDVVVTGGEKSRRAEPEGAQTMREKPRAVAASLLGKGSTQCGLNVCRGTRLNDGVVDYLGVR